VNAPAAGPPRRLAVLVLLGIACHVVLTGSRVAVSLTALAHGATAFTVGVLIALYALLPMLAAVKAGRLLDRIGVRRPMLVGATGLVVGAACGLLGPGLWALAATATLVGMSFMTFQVATQRAAGEIGGPQDRPRNFSLLALGYSISGFLGPLIAGFSIDQFGYRAPYAVLVVVAMVPAALLAANRVTLPQVHRGDGVPHRGGVRELLRHRGVRRAVGTNVLVSLGWDLYIAFVPVYGARIGLTASQIGMVLAAFAAATFVVRFAIPTLVRRATEQQVLSAALLLAGAVYAIFPFLRDAWTLGALSFCLGLGLGSGQPMVMSLLHAHAPPGRIGEAVGVRMSVVQSSQVVVPLLFGAIGASIGLAPVFWAVGACLASGGWLLRRSGRG